MVTRLDRQLTARDLDGLPHEWDTLYELIGGVLYMSRRPSNRHQRIIATLVMELGPCVRATGGDALPEPGMVWEEDGEDNVSPDLAILIGKAAPAVGKLRACPEIVIEVLSPGEENRRRDLEAKRDLYWRRGAREYWIIDLEKEAVLRLVRGTKDWTEERLGREERVATPLLPDWSGVMVAKIFS